MKVKMKNFSACPIIFLCLIVSACSDDSSVITPIQDLDGRASNKAAVERESEICSGNVFEKSQSDYLYSSINFGNAACVKEILDSGFNPNTELKKFGSGEKISPLFLALDSTFFLTKDKTAILRFLIEAGANLNVKKEGKSIAHYLVESTRNNDNEVIDYLLSLKKLPLNEEFSGNTPLTYSISKNNVNYAEKLIKNNVDLEKSLNSEKPISLALRNNMFGLVNLMVQKGANLQIEKNGNTLLHEALMKSREVISTNNRSLYANIIKRMTKKEILTQNNQEETALLIAVRSGLLDVVELLLDANADVNVSSRRSSVLIEAIKNNDVEIYKLIAKKTSNFESKLDGVPLVLASQLGNEQIVDDLLMRNVNVNETNANQDSALHLANSVSIMKKLIDKGANLNVLDKNGQTALFKATRENSKERIKLLLSVNSTNKNIIDINGESILFSATDLESLNLLMTKDNINIVNKKGMTVLTKILMDHLNLYDNTKLTMINKLLEDGVDVKRSNEEISLLNKIVSSRTKVENQNELMINQSELVKLFLNKVDINKTDINGNTPFHVVDTEAETKELLKSNIRVDLTIINKNRKTALKVQNDVLNEIEFTIDLINNENEQKQINYQEDILKLDSANENERKKLVESIEKLKETIAKNEDAKTNFYYPLVSERLKIIKLIETEMNK